jgi:hypothetical protein
MTIIEIIHFVKFMTFAEFSEAYVTGKIDEDTFDACAYIWAVSADRGATFADFLKLPESKRAGEIIESLQAITPHPYAGAY